MSENKVKKFDPENRDTEVFKTSIEGHKVEVLKWITGEEEMEITDEIRKRIKFDKKGMADVDATVNTDQEVEAMKKIVVSINDDRTNIINKIKSMVNVDYREVRDKVNDIIEGKGFLDKNSQKQEESTKQENSQD